MTNISLIKLEITIIGIFKIKCIIVTFNILQKYFFVLKTNRKRVNPNPFAPINPLLFLTTDF